MPNKINFHRMQRAKVASVKKLIRISNKVVLKIKFIGMSRVTIVIRAKNAIDTKVDPK
jgi:hypothetical protein